MITREEFHESLPTIINLIRPSLQVLSLQKLQTKSKYTNAEYLVIRFYPEKTFVDGHPECFLKLVVSYDLNYLCPVIGFQVFLYTTEEDDDLGEFSNPDEFDRLEVDSPCMSSFSLNFDASYLFEHVVHRGVTEDDQFVLENISIKPHHLLHSENYFFIHPCNVKATYEICEDGVAVKHACHRGVRFMVWFLQIYGRVVGLNLEWDLEKLAGVTALQENMMTQN
ncbi:hypothetical protein BABINDRAFT_161006 [Babjeviella inositovora NRRL Y-12698]|uniref:Uncharacterized protein n=1 Tax=Babjeviella inositovora NRRL Y-12698 TaxID=984486 RepID=A0A1E3QSW2_9ASCO|nr:uncharacterized protein BABINDRAFT_161006 [Babjeviella inositovora NRRL Y-12698]ODQ80796.1 hypothetical protein BABINDRAFT_161006 [Babjeviella inositovora NRRL Y-12698]